MTKDQLKARLHEYIRRHREGLTITEIGVYARNLDIDTHDFDTALFDLIQEGAIFQKGVEFLPLEPMEDLPDLMLSARQKERCLDLLATWYDKWRHTMTDDHAPHRLGFALEDLKLLLTCNAQERHDAATKMEAIRRRSPALAQVIEGLDVSE